MSLIASVLLVLSWLTTEHFLPWVSWHAEALTFFAVFLVAWTGVAQLLKGVPASPIRIPLLAVPFALFGVIAVVQNLTGLLEFRGDVVVIWFYASLCIVCLILGFNSGKAAEAEPRLAGSEPWAPASWLALAFVIGALASVLVAFAQVLDLWEHSAYIVRMGDLRRPGGNLGQPNQLATLLVMGVASVAFLHVSGKLAGWVSALVLFVLCAGIAITESRTGVLGLMALLLWWQLKRSTVANQVSPWAGPGVAAVFLALFVIWPHLLNSLDVLDSQVQNRFGQGDVRLALWSQLLEAVWQRPWFGWGINEVAEAHNSVAHAHPVNNPFSYSHNLVIDWAVWMGLPIALALTVLSAVWLWRRLRAARELTPWFCIAVAVPVATHSMLELPFAYAYFLAPVLFLLGVLEASVGAKPLLTVRPRAGAVALLLVTGALLGSAVEYVAIEEDFRTVRFEQLRIGKTPDDQHKPNVVLLTQLGALLTGSRINLEPGLAPDKLDELKNLALRYPWVATQYRYALALALNGNRQEAVRQFQVIRWQRGEKLYEKIRLELAGLAQQQYPQLRTLVLP